MPTPAYIYIEGITQGNITAEAFSADSVGNVYVEGHENQILVQEIKHEVTVPTDPQSGQPTGKRVHKPFTFVSGINKATPLLYTALTKGEKLPNVEVMWYRPSEAGGEEHFFTTQLIDAIITNIDLVMPHAQQAENQSVTHLVSVSMSYRKIVWNHVIARTEGSDDWRESK